MTIEVMLSAQFNGLTFCLDEVGTGREIMFAQFDYEMLDMAERLGFVPIDDKKVSHIQQAVEFL